MGKVAWGFTASLDGFIAGPDHDMSWLSEAVAPEPDLLEAMAADVAVIISGRAGYDAARRQVQERDELTSEAYGGAWSGTELVLTHRPEEIADDPTIVPMDGDVREVVRRAQQIADGKDVQIISADIARQALEHDLIDELQVFVAPVFLGEGIRIFQVPGGRRVHWELVESPPGAAAAWGRVYRPRRPARGRSA